MKIENRSTQNCQTNMFSICGAQEPVLGTCCSLESCLNTRSWEPCLNTLLGNLFLGTLLGNLFLQTLLGTCAWDPALESCLGTCSLEPCLRTCSCNPCKQGNLSEPLGSSGKLWEPLRNLRNLFLGTLFGNLAWNLGNADFGCSNLLRDLCYR